MPVYLSPRKRLITMRGTEASATFFAPWDRDVEPYIRIATGGYPNLRDGLASFIVSLSHEVIHYQQWIETGEVWERRVAARADTMLRQYEQAVVYPKARSPLSRSQASEVTTSSRITRFRLVIDLGRAGLDTCRGPNEVSS